ncbi:glycoside hydrolase family 53 protein [Uliginosibacterium gangwonense]|uniref:glycoside hydrolase family 53 protein n=1 Tax=Uliginosibacterium gangwonense TaxID=392736 RepID=UPI001FE0AD62|nr:glycosyl hydrolase 53 family protein [Uliginosibacterium gangwonense]
MKWSAWTAGSLACLCMLGMVACGGGGGSGSSSDGSTGTPISSVDFAYGADVSWVTQEEASSKVFYSASNIATDPFALLKNLGTNAIRLRVWVNPSDGWNNTADTLAKAKRAAALGQRIMIDFHYSDTWADPAHQTKPSAWANDSYEQLKLDVYNHTHDVLNTLKTNGITVEWVQVGNEINSGMLWPEGKYDNFPQLAGLINSGYTAAKAVYPNTQVVIHLSNGYDNSMYRWFFDGIKNAGAKWDVIGMSHYPDAASWSTYNTNIATNMTDMVARYGKPIMVAEIGMDWQQANAAKAMIADLISKVKAQGSYGLGVFYWEPAAYPGWNGYQMGALNNSGQFTQALDAYH